VAKEALQERREASATQTTRGQKGSNTKVFILGTYHGLRKDSLQSYLDEFWFRFHRRSFGGALLDRLALAIGSSVRLY